MTDDPRAVSQLQHAGASGTLKGGSSLEDRVRFLETRQRDVPFADRFSSEITARRHPDMSIPTRWFTADPAACRAARDHVSSALRAWGCDDDTVSDAALLVSELTGNVVAHSPSRSVGIDVGVFPARQRVEIAIREQAVSDLPACADHPLMSFSADTSHRRRHPRPRPGARPASQPGQAGAA